MKQIKVSDKAAAMIEQLRDSSIGTMEGEYEGLLEAISGLNNLISAGRDSEEVAFYANDAQRALDKILDYFDLLKVLHYECDPLEDGEVKVTQAKWAEARTTKD